MTDVQNTEKGGLMSAFRKAMPATHFTTKWGAITTGGVSAAVGAVTAGLMMGAGAGPLALLGGAVMFAGAAVTMGLNITLPVIGGVALIEGIYKLVKNAQDERKQQNIQPSAPKIEAQQNL